MMMVKMTIKPKNCKCSNNDENKVDLIKFRKNEKLNEKGISTKNKQNENKAKSNEPEKNPGKPNKICKKCGTSHKLFNSLVFNKSCLFCKKKEIILLRCVLEKRLIIYIRSQFLLVT